jgi:hypothetical protein
LNASHTEKNTSYIHILTGHSLTPEKYHRGSEDQDQGVIIKYSSRKSPQFQNPNPKQSKLKHAIDPAKSLQEPKETFSTATYMNKTLQQHKTWIVNGQTYVFDEKVKSSKLASLQFEMQLDNVIQIANKCLTGCLELGTREILFKDDVEGRVIIFSADKRPGKHFEYSFDMFLTSKPCPDNIPRTHPNFQAAITLSDDQATWELNLYHVTSFSSKSKPLKDSITKIDGDITNHIRALINRVIIFVNTLVFVHSKLSKRLIDEDSSINFSSVKRMVYEHGGDKQRKDVAKFFVNHFKWMSNHKTNRFANKDSAIYTFPMI